LVAPNPVAHKTSISPSLTGADAQFYAGHYDVCDTLNVRAHRVAPPEFGERQR
jgi:hypothetical protein